MRKLFLLTVICFSTVLLSSCRRSNDPFKSKVSGDFVYSHRQVANAHENVAIIGLSEEGQAKETIVFPTEIDGFKVQQLGTFDVKRRSGPIIFKNAKNIYFSSFHTQPITSFEYHYNENVEELNIFLGTRGSTVSDFCVHVTKEAYKNSKIYVPLIHYNMMLDIPHKFEKYNYALANVVYYLSEDEKDIFFVDDVDGTVVNVIPPNPYKEGYRFVGWYKDIGGTVKWDFDKDIVPKKEYDEEGNYLFKETKIYAKWEEK